MIRKLILSALLISFFSQSLYAKQVIYKKCTVNNRRNQPTCFSVHFNNIKAEEYKGPLEGAQKYGQTFGISFALESGAIYDCESDEESGCKLLSDKEVGKRLSSLDYAQYLLEQEIEKGEVEDKKTLAYSIVLTLLHGKNDALSNDNEKNFLKKNDISLDDKEVNFEHYFSHFCSNEEALVDQYKLFYKVTKCCSLVRVTNIVKTLSIKNGSIKGIDPGKYLFSIDMKGQFQAFDKKYENDYFHCTFGQNPYACGEMLLKKDGHLILFNASGHFRPGLERLMVLKKALELGGYKGTIDVKTYILMKKYFEN